ncbi:MAG: D-glycero-beta-D-manno-heptose 1,7-bisphosphate 7-phosphatase [Desulfobacteraceae bacterium]
MKRPAIFIDRDGTINEQMGYINHLSRFNILPGVPEAIKLLNENNYLVIVVTNQSGIARGYFSIELVEEIHTYMKDSLKKEGAEIDAVFFCPHYPGSRLKEYDIKCGCRKPNTGMIRQALDKFDIDLTQSYMIGDHYTDLEFASNANIKSIMVKTGYGLGEVDHILPALPYQPEYIADDLLDAVKWIIDDK